MLNSLTPGREDATENGETSLLNHP